MMSRVVTSRSYFSFDSRESKNKYLPSSLTRSEYRVRHRIPNLYTLTRGLVADSRDRPPPLLPSHERQVAGVKTLAVVRVDEVDAGVLVLYDDLTGLQLRSGVVVFDLKGVGVTDLPYYRRLVDFVFRVFRGELLISINIIGKKTNGKYQIIATIFR